MWFVLSDQSRLLALVVGCAVLLIACATSRTEAPVNAQSNQYAPSLLSATEP